MFYRLNVVPLSVPSLTERREDIPALVEHFFTRYANEQGVPPPEISGDAMTALQTYEWPGNVRQLRNVVERTVILTPRDKLGLIEAEMLPPEIQHPPAGRFAHVIDDGRAAAGSAREFRA